jgi:hypothetical protein
MNRLSHGFQVCGCTRRQGHISPGPGQGERTGPADALACASDDGHAAGEAEGF